MNTDYPKTLFILALAAALVGAVFCASRAQKSPEKPHIKVPIPNPLCPDGKCPWLPKVE